MSDVVPYSTNVQMCMSDLASSPRFLHTTGAQEPGPHSSDLLTPQLPPLPAEAAAQARQAASPSESAVLSRRASYAGRVNSPCPTARSRIGWRRDLQEPQSRGCSLSRRRLLRRVLPPRCEREGTTDGTITGRRLQHLRPSHLIAPLCRRRRCVSSTLSRPNTAL